MRHPIIFSHGSDSGPEATKTSALAALAQSLGWPTQRLDYREDDALGHAACVEPRLRRLRAAMDAVGRPAVLVGSSMGAFVSGLASLQAPVAALFLLATPERISGQEMALDLRDDVPTLLIHGWHDELCPVEGMLAFAERRSLPLLIVDDDHRLGASLDGIVDQFRVFLGRLDAAA